MPTIHNCITQNGQQCTDGVHVQSEMHVPGMFSGHGMGGRDTPAYYTLYEKESKSTLASFLCWQIEQQYIRVQIHSVARDLQY